MNGERFSAGQPPDVSVLDAIPVDVITLRFSAGQAAAIQPFAEWLSSGEAWAAFGDWYDAGERRPVP